MVLHIMLKNFGKVESADIVLNDLVVLVGNNNSGKTMVMQLIYGIRESLRNFPVPVSGAKKSDLNGQYLIRCDQDWFREIVSRINEYLAGNKSQIIESIFGTLISAEEIKIALEGTETTYFVSSVSEYRNRGEEGQRTVFGIDTRQYENGENVKTYESRVLYRDGLEDGMSEALRIVWSIILSGKTTMDSGQLFLPASRSGLQMLYKHYFTGESESNLVMPVKDFLRFLQLYSEEKRPDESRRALLEFGEKYLLQGRVVQKGDETLYVDRHVGRPVSLYIASSMIHELTPFIKALSATQRIDWLYCDEVENSLHPLMGYEFRLFGDNLDKLYDEADKITRQKMSIRARKLKEAQTPGKTELYEVGNSCDIAVEEKQEDGSVDQVILQYCVTDKEVGYYGALFLLNDEILSDPQDIDDILQRDQKGLLELYFLTMGNTERFAQQLERLFDDLDAVEKGEKWLDTLFGFIEHTPDNVFFHEFDNPDMDRSYTGKKVSYKIVRDSGQERAINVRLMKSQRYE